MKYEFVEKQVIVKGQFELAATLTIPQGIKGKMPALVIVCGTGKGDRDGNVKKIKMNLNIYKLLSDFFAELGFITIRYDKRGVAESKGDAYRAGMNDLVDDIISNVEFLKTLPLVDRDRIILLGHSEGCILSTIAHSRHPVGGLILVAGAGATIKTALTYQNLAVYEEVQHMKGLRGIFLRKLITKENALSKVNKLFKTVQASSKDVMRIQLMKFPAKWLREHLSYSDEDILKLLGEAGCPVLAITGDRDVQANPEDLKIISALGKGNITCVVTPFMDHMLREYRGEKSMFKAKKQYTGEMDKPLNGAFLNELKRWVKEHIL